jgi:hypothetical protein
MTDESCPFGMVPPGDAGQRGLIFYENREEFATIAPYATGYDFTTKCQVNFETPLSERTKGSVKIDFAGFADYEWRSQLRHRSLVEVERAFVDHCREVWPGVSIQGVQFHVPVSLSDKFWVEATFEVRLSDAERGYVPGPWIALDRQLDVWKRNSTQRLNGGYPFKFIQTVHYQLSGEKVSSQIEKDQSDQIKNLLEYKITNQGSNDRFISTSYLSLSNPDITVQQLSDVRNRLDLWSYLTRKPIRWAD